MNVFLAPRLFPLQINLYPFYFGEYYHWLIYDSQEDPLSLANLWRRFSNASLSVNADISYAVHANVSTEMTQFIIYDVYNNGHQIGGQLNVTVDYSIECDFKECSNLTFISDLHQRPLYGNRNNLYDINFPVAALVSVFIKSYSYTMQHHSILVIYCNIALDLCQSQMFMNLSTFNCIFIQTTIDSLLHTNGKYFIIYFFFSI